MKTACAKTSVLLFAALACTLVRTSNATAQEPSRYMGGPAELATAPNGAIANKSALAVFPQIFYTSPTVEKIADGVWVIGGYSVANMSVIEAPDGLIVYDTGDNAEEGKHFLAAIREKISQKPIKAIIYSHSHYALGGAALVDDPNSVMVIGHPKLNDTVKSPAGCCLLPVRCSGLIDPGLSMEPPVEATPLSVERKSSGIDGRRFFQS